MTDVVDVTPRPRRGRLALAATGVAAAALLVPALGADALQIGGTFTGGPSQVTQGDTITLTATGCVPTIINDNQTAAPQAVVQFSVSIDGGSADKSPPFPTDNEGTVNFSGPVTEGTPPGTYVFTAVCGVADGQGGLTPLFAYDSSVTIKVVAPTTTTKAPTTSTTVRPPATTPLAPAARAAAATPRFTG